MSEPRCFFCPTPINLKDRQSYRYIDNQTIACIPCTLKYVDWEAGVQGELWRRRQERQALRDAIRRLVFALLGWRNS